MLKLNKITGLDNVIILGCSFKNGLANLIYDAEYMNAIFVEVLI